MRNMRRITRFEVYAVDNDIYLENGEVRITNPDIKVCLACDVGDLENKTEEIILHHKYKRCLNNAEICKARYDEEDAKVNGCGASWEYISPEMKYWERWRWRWLELAEKLKEA